MLLWISYCILYGVDDLIMVMLNLRSACDYFQFYFKSYTILKHMDVPIWYI